MSTITEQLNWRGGNKVASLSGMTPILPRSYWSPSDTDAARELKRATKDYSAYEDEESAEEERRRTGRKRRDDEVPYGQYGLVRGFDFEDSQAMGPLLEQSALPLRDPISRWYVARLSVRDLRETSIAHSSNTGCPCRIRTLSIRVGLRRSSAACIRRPGIRWSSPRHPASP